MTSITDEWAEDAPASAETTPAPPAKPKSKKPKKPKKKPDPPPLEFPTVDAFVTEYLAPTIRRNLLKNTLTWCPDWWRHPEAVSRLTAIWRAWENLRLDPALGISTWWLHHCDPHLRVLMDPDTGPLSGCNPKKGHTRHALGPLPITPSDPALWLTPAFSTEPEHEDNGV
ncbi:DUF4913 domain-containing protein [Streptomyces sp. NPDC047525]|uniref:DUF4913 domain-containing protein n=1 Tax=Streptomyces sp. NPDC047525 TaxID=3155264 RepID=UPI003405AB81